MSDLATLVVKLEAQTASYQASLDKATKRLDRFEREAGGILGRASRQFSAFGARINGVLGLLGAGVSLSGIVSATAEAEKAFGNLANAVKQNGGAAGRSAEQLADYASELQRVTTFSDDAVQNAQALLLRFREIGGQNFDRATESVLNLAQALGTDLQTNAKLVGRALADPERGVRALAKAGIAFSDTQQKLIKDLAESGQRAKAQEVILGELERRYGGAARAARDTFGGALEGVKNALGDLLEVKGGLPQATESLNELAKTLTDPAVKAGADALFSAILRGASGAVDVLGKTAAGLNVIFGNTGDRVEELDRQIRFLESERDSLLPVVTLFGKSDMNPDGGFSVLAGKALDERIAALKRLQLEVATAIKPPPAKGGAGGASAPDGDAAAAALENLDKLQKEGKSLTDSLRTPLEKYGDEIAKADRLLAAHVITFDTWARAVAKAGEELRSGAGDVNDYEAALQNMLEELPQQFDEFAGAQLDEVDKALADIPEEVDKALEKVGQRSKELESIYDEAARGAQRAFADFLFDPLKDGFEGLYQSFANTLRRMAAEAASAKLFEIIGGFFGGMAGKGGFLGAVGSIGSAIFGGPRDEGGPAQPGMAYAIGTRAQPELFVPHTAGSFVPAHKMGMTVYQTFQLPPGSVITRQTEGQLGAAAARGLGVASRRNG